MLASEDDGGALDAMRFSLASDIVELVVLTDDELFLQTLREAVGGARRLWHVPSADKVSDLLVAGEVGIFVLDVQALNETAAVFIGQIKRQFPDLVVVVAGNRDAETSIAALISAGTVYRFIHKPMSPGRAKLFADAAVKKYDEQRKRAASAPAVKHSSSYSGWLIGIILGSLAAILVGMWAVQRNASETTRVPHPMSVTGPPVVESPVLTQAAAALAANRLTEPAGDNALELYLRAQARNPSDPIARAGLDEVHERLLAKAENSLLEERLDEAAAAIETARKAGVEAGRIAFLTAQLAKSRDQVKAAQALTRARSEVKVGEDRITSFLALAAQRLNEGRLTQPERDSARFYVQEALRLDPTSGAAHDVQQSLAARLSAEARGAIERRDFTRAADILEAAKGIIGPTNLEAMENSLTAARGQANAEAWAQLLKSATERLQQDRLIEPENDSAKYYLSTLRSVDPRNPGLAPALKDLGSRLVAKARGALALGQYDAARSWVDDAAAAGAASGDLTAVQQDLEIALAQQRFMTNVVSANDLTLVKSVQPVYPPKAETKKTQGWVELDFTVSPSGTVRDITVHAASNPGVFENAAMSALSQWRYKPAIRDAKPIAQRARIRIRFTLAT